MRIRCISLNSCVDRILVADDFRIGSHCRARLLAEQPAGKAVNVARILAVLGANNRLTALVGEDRRIFFHRYLGRMPHLRLELIAASTRTRINTTILDQRHKTETHIREYGETVASAAWRTLVRTLTAGASEWMVFCGAMPPGVNARRFGGLLRRLRRAGKKTLVDSSGFALATAVSAGVDLIKPNRSELAEMLGVDGLRSEDIVDAAQQIRRQNPNLDILVSDGANGAFFVGKAGIWQAKAMGNIKVVSTVGAGDALLAGFLWGMAKKEVPPECLFRAVKVATASLACAAAGEIDRALLAKSRNIVLLPRCR